MKTVNTENINLWCLWNAKSISEGWFQGSVGMLPTEFFKQNKKECLAHWNEFCLEIYPKETNKKPKTDCTCVWEKNQSPNGSRNKGKEMIRLWYCPEHKNRFTSLEEIK